MHALAHSTLTLLLCRDWSNARARAAELVALGEQKHSKYWKANGMLWLGCLMVEAGNPTDAVQTLTRALAAYAATGATIYRPFVLIYLARAHSEVEQSDQALGSDQRSCDHGGGDEGIVVAARSPPNDGTTCSEFAEPGYSKSYGAF